MRLSQPACTSRRAVPRGTRHRNEVWRHDRNAGRGRGARARSNADKPLLVGSVKANIGHLESAGGVSGLIKVVLAMQHGIIPRQVHFDEPNPDIQWDRLPVRMVTEPTAWPDGELRVAAVTALGMSGTNAHLVLRSSNGQATDEDDETKPPRPFHLLPRSARSPETLQHVAQRLDSFLSETPEVDVADACYTAAVGRKHFEHRAALVINSIDQMHQLLGALRSDEESANLFTGQASRSTQIAWLFSDSIPWAVGVGRQLYETQPVFRACWMRVTVPWATSCPVR